MDKSRAWYQGWPVVIEKIGTASSGWYGPPKGTHGKGSQGGFAVNVFGATTEDETAKLEKVLREVGVPSSHVDGVRFTTDPPYGYTATDSGRFRNEATGKDAWGKYVRAGRERRIHISPEALAQSPNAIVHELGHHITTDIGKNVFGAQYKALERAVGRARKAPSLHRMGLREYSFKDSRELMADMYTVRYCGSSSQWATLSDWATEGELGFVLEAIE